MACDHQPGVEGEEGFLCGTCGKRVPGLPLDHAFEMPDDIWALGEDERARRTGAFGTDLWRLDGRFFLRCLLPVPIPGDEFCFGVWVEVDRTTVDAAMAVWDDPAGYARLRFDGVLANELDPKLSPVRGAHVMLATRDAKSRPFVVVSSDTAVTRLLSIGWTGPEYLALVRGWVS